MIKIARFLKDFRKQVILGPIFKLVEAIFELIVPLVMASIIDVGIAQGDTGYILRMGAVMVGLGVVGLGCSLFCQYSAAKASQGFGTVVRNALFAHINRLSHREIDAIGTPSLITRLTSDVNQLQLAVAMLIRLVIRAPFLVIGATVMAMTLDLRLSIIFWCAAPLIALALYAIMSRSVPFFGRIQGYLDRISLITRENLSGVRVIRAFHKQEAEKARFDSAADELTRATIRVGKISALLSPLTFIIVNLAIVAILYFGGIRVDAGHLTQGELIAIINYMNQILLALIVVANLVVIFTKAAASAARVNAVLDIVPSVEDPAGADPVPVPGAPRIAFRNVSFAYGEAQENALTDISLEIRPGETLGIIGGTGSGKSTLVNLIPRFYNVTAGSILVDGVDISQAPLSWLRGKMGIVPQRTLLFSGTLRENMQWRQEDASDASIHQALEVAQAAEFVDKLPDGLNTRVEQGGRNFSGGQRQRLTIARALVGHPDILILDDSASALDFATDAALRRSIRRETAGCTVLMVSQRVHTVRGADRILVLDEGRIAGLGTHETLFESCQVYREICLSQLREEEVRQNG